MRFLPTALLLMTLALASAGCGVGFGSAPEGNEFFKSAKVTGDLHAGGSLTGAITYQSTYPISVQVLCEIREGKDLVKSLGSETVAPVPDGSPKKTPVAGSYSYDFIIADPGAYKFECYTALDQDNYIIREFTIAPGASGATGTPTSTN